MSTTTCPRALRLTVCTSLLIAFTACDELADTEPRLDELAAADDDNIEEDASARPTDDLNLIAPDDAGPLDSQCGGTWDLQDVERYDGTLGVSQAFVARHERHVGHHLTVGCSGTLISDDLFLSAGHCNYAVNHVVRFDFQNDAAGNARTPRNFTVTQVVEQQYDGTWDYAIVRLGGSPGREYGHANIAAVDPPTNARMTIIQHPDWQQKQVHTGPLLDYSSNQGANWFRHQVDTLGGSSGSGVLNDAGQLIGVHTNAGCAQSGAIKGNSAMRMSKLVPHSPTLRALARSKILWSSDQSETSIWTVEPDGTRSSDAYYGPLPGWTPISFADNRALWRHTSGRISVWVLNDAGQQLSYAESGPYDGWTAVNYANERILWRHTSGTVSLWTVNSVGNYVSHVEHSAAPGWSAVSYANNRLLWKHTSGALSLWVLDDAGNLLSNIDHGALPGWTPLHYANGELLLRNADGRSSMRTVDRAGQLLSWTENGPFAGWTALALIDRRMMWRHSTGTLSYWTTNSDGAHMSYVEHGPFAGWSPLFTADGRP